MGFTWRRRQTYKLRAPVYDKRKVIAILPYSQYPETDELSFEKGEIFVVHNDMGDGWLWVSSQSTGLGGIVNKELVQELNGNVDPVEANAWYHSDITKQEAARRLEQVGPGSWLVRPSDSTQGDYSLFFHCNEQIKRFKIQKQSGKYLMGGRYFESITEIVERYKTEQIVEGHILGTAVLRPRTSMLSDDSLLNRNGQDIYSTMRQSSGSNFFLNRKDNIVINGFLNKKSQKTKKWKNMFFVLNGTEQQLYYFENQKRSKPKGLIDLSYTSIYPVDDSLFGRPNCFQLVLKALNQVSVSYLCADTSDEAQEWIQELKSYCTNTIPKTKPKSLYPVLTELRSLQIKICDARKLSVKHTPHPYCILSLNDVKVCRTQVKEAPDPCWQEDFILDDIPPDIESLTISVYNKGKRSKDAEVASVKIMLSELTPGQRREDWHLLSAAGYQTSKGHGEAGSLRASVQYLHEVIMPCKEYASLKELLVNKTLETALALCDVCADNNDRTPLASALLLIFRHERMEALLLKTLNDQEIDDKVVESASLFRGTTMATTLMSHYMRMTTSAFVHAALQPTIDKIMESKASCEINSQMLENPGDVDVNGRHLLSILHDCVTSIFMSTDSCPLVLRHICWCLQNKVKSSRPNDMHIKTRVVSAFIFLRLLCPAILKPREYNLITEAPSPTAARTLKLVANCLIKLANLGEAKEPYMELVNPFIRDNQERMIMFLDELSNLPETPSIPEVPGVDIARSLATVHQICVKHLDRLQDKGTTLPMVKKLVTITDMLTKHKQLYMSQ